jgi:hypothetical protein
MKLQEQGPWGSLSEDPHHNRFHCMSNALLALIIEAMLGRDSNCSKSGRPSGCAVLNFKAKLPSME